MRKIGFHSPFSASFCPILSSFSMIWVAAWLRGSGHMLTTLQTAGELAG
jgi:hypothetical protein